MLRETADGQLAGEFWGGRDGKAFDVRDFPATAGGKFNQQALSKGIFALTATTEADDFVFMQNLRGPKASGGCGARSMM